MRKKNPDRVKYKIGDLVCEIHHQEWVGVVLATYDKNINTDYEEQQVVVEWVNNNNNISSSPREELSSKYLKLVNRG